MTPETKHDDGGPAYPHESDLREGDKCPKCNGTGNAATPPGITLADGPFPCDQCYGRGRLYNPHADDPQWWPSLATPRRTGMSLWAYYAGQAQNEKMYDCVAEMSDEQLAACVKASDEADMIPYLMKCDPKTFADNFMLRSRWEAILRARLRYIEADAMIAEMRRREGKGHNQ